MLVTVIELVCITLLIKIHLLFVIQKINTIFLLFVIQETQTVLLASLYGHQLEMIADVYLKKLYKILINTFN